MAQTEKLRQYFVSRAKRQRLLAAAATSPKKLKGSSADASVKADTNSSAPTAKRSTKRIMETGPKVNTKAPGGTRHNVEALYNTLVRGARTKKGAPPSVPSRANAPSRPQAASSNSASKTPAMAPKPSSTPAPAPRPSSAPATSPKPQPRASLVTAAASDKKKRKPFEGKRAIRRGEDI